MTGIIAGSGGASSSNLTESADVLRERGSKTRWTLSSDAHDELDHLRLPGHRLLDSGRQLLDHLSLRDQRPLYWQCAGSKSSWASKILSSQAAGRRSIGR